jgi:hypothetical protein
MFGGEASFIGGVTMKRVMFALLSLALAGASFALEASAAPAMTTTIISNTPFVGTVLNNCFNGLPVTFSGVRHETITVTGPTPSGYVNFVDHVNFSNVKGTDLSGNSYVGYVQLRRAYPCLRRSSYNASDLHGHGQHGFGPQYSGAIPHAHHDKPGRQCHIADRLIYDYLPPP